MSLEWGLVLPRKRYVILSLSSIFCTPNALIIKLIPTLRSTEYFGKYGKISKIVLVKRTEPNGTPVVGMYITYHRREDAARAIAAVDLTPSPGAENTVVRASYGTTKYCLSFLRNVPCTNHGCLDLHEWGDDKDSFTKQDLSSLFVMLYLVMHGECFPYPFACRKHAQKETDRPQVTVVQSRTKEEEPDGKHHTSLTIAVRSFCLE